MKKLILRGAALRGAHDGRPPMNVDGFFHDLPELETGRHMFCAAIAPSITQ